VKACCRSRDRQLDRNLRPHEALQRSLDAFRHDAWKDAAVDRHRAIAAGILGMPAAHSVARRLCAACHQRRAGAEQLAACLSWGCLQSAAWPAEARVWPAITRKYSRVESLHMTGTDRAAASPAHRPAHRWHCRRAARAVPTRMRTVSSYSHRLLGRLQRVEEGGHRAHPVRRALSLFRRTRHQSGRGDSWPGRRRSAACLSSPLKTRIRSPVARSPRLQAQERLGDADDAHLISSVPRPKK